MTLDKSKGSSLCWIRELEWSETKPRSLRFLDQHHSQMAPKLKTSHHILLGYPWQHPKKVELLTCVYYCPETLPRLVWDVRVSKSCHVCEMKKKKCKS